MTALAAVTLVATPGLAWQESIRDESLQQLVQQLGGETFQERQAAMRDLIAAGNAAIEPLMQAIESADPESQMRALAVLSRLAVGDDDDTRTKTQQLIRELVDSDDPNIARLAQRTVQTLGRQLQQNAMEQLQAQGAVISGQTQRGIGRRPGDLELIIGPAWKGQRADLQPVRWLVDLTKVTLIGPQIDDELVESLVNLPQLGRVVIRRGAITNASIVSFLKMQSLRRLELVYCNIDDGCFDDLKKFKTGSADARVPDLLLYGTGLSMEIATRLQQEADLEVDLRRGAFLGIYYQPSDGPCQITRVIPNSAAERGGIEAGDIIEVFAGKPIENGNDFRGGVRHLAPGDQVAVSVLRGDESVELTIVLGEFPDFEE